MDNRRGVRALWHVWGDAAPRGRELASILVAVFAVTAVAAFVAVNLGWRGTHDSYFHLDYAYQLWHGHLPAPDGTEMPYLDNSPYGPSDTMRQFASAHPPLYYALIAPVVGPLVDSGHVVAAIAAVRAINVGIATALAFTLAVCGWRFGGGQRERWAVALPIVVGMTSTLAHFSGDTYHDVLLTLLATVTWAVAADAIARRPGWGHAVAMAIPVALGMATKATFAVVVVTAVLALLIGNLKHDGVSWRSALAACLKAATVGAAALASTGWFFVRNYMLSGSWARSSEKAPLQGRELRTVADNLGDPHFYLILPERLLGNTAWPDAFPINFAVSLLAVAAGIVIALWRFRPLVASRRTLPFIALALLAIGGHYAAQLYHAVGYGSYNVRYFFPVLPLIGVVLAVPIVAAARWRLMAAVAGTGLVGAVVVNETLLGSRLAPAGASVAETTFAGALANGYSVALPMAMLAIAVALLWTPLVLGRGEERSASASQSR